jgi:hypothetical protein
MPYYETLDGIVFKKLQWFETHPQYKLIMVTYIPPTESKDLWTQLSITMSLTWVKLQPLTQRGNYE